MSEVDAPSVDGAVADSEKDTAVRPVSRIAGAEPTVDGTSTLRIPEEVGHFHPVSHLGEGAAALVLLARDRDIPGRQVALKVLKPEGIAPDLPSLRKEAAALAALQHPHILTVHEIGISEVGPYLATEYMPGGTLARRLASGPLKVDEALRHARALAAALAAAHERGILHRDIKPANLFLTSEGQLKVADFGMARRDPSHEASIDGLPLEHGRVIAGTPRYMAPEVRQGREVSPRADQYSFGVVLHEMLTGRRPKRDQKEGDGGGARENDRHMPRELAPIVRRCLAPEPEERFPSMRHVLAALERVHRAHHPARRRLRRVIVSFTIVFALLALAWLAVSWARRSRSRALSDAGMVALEAGHHDEALRALVAALRADPDNRHACASLGALARHMDSTAVATAHLQDCAVSFPDAPAVLYNLGAILAREGDLEAAEKPLRDALDLARDTDLETAVLNELALVLLETGRPGDAWFLLADAPSPEPVTLDGAYLRRTQGLVLLELGRHDEAVVALHEALAGPLEAPARSAALVSLGQAREAQGDASSARRAYSESLLGEPDRTTALKAQEGLERLQLENSEVKENLQP